MGFFRVYVRCIECGRSDTYSGYSRMHAYGRAMGKGWGACGLDKWMCGKCWRLKGQGNTLKDGEKT